MTQKRKQDKLEQHDPETGKIYVESVDQIPCFASDEEEFEFWETHSPTMKLFGPRPRTLEEALREAQTRTGPER
jgi:hypothetical protein